MKTVFFALCVVAMGTSLCFAEPALISYGNDTNANANRTSQTAPVAAQVSNVSVAAPRQISNTTSSAPAEVITFTGKVNSVSNGNMMGGASPQINVKDENGMETIFVITNDTTIIGKDGNPVTLNWIGQNENVKIEYIMNSGGTKTATSIKVLAGW